MALADPDLAYNVSVMRAHDARREMKIELLFQQLSADEIGMSQIVSTLKLLYMEW